MSKFKIQDTDEGKFYEPLKLKLRGFGSTGAINLNHINGMLAEVHPDLKGQPRLNISAVNLIGREEALAYIELMVTKILPDVVKDTPDESNIITDKKLESIYKEWGIFS